MVNRRSEWARHDEIPYYIGKFDAGFYGISYNKKSDVFEAIKIKEAIELYKTKKDKFSHGSQKIMEEIIFTLDETNVW